MESYTYNFRYLYLSEDYIYMRNGSKTRSTYSEKKYYYKKILQMIINYADVTHQRCRRTCMDIFSYNFDHSSTSNLVYHDVDSCTHSFYDPLSDRAVQHTSSSMTQGSHPTIHKHLLSSNHSIQSRRLNTMLSP